MLNYGLNCVYNYGLNCVYNYGLIACIFTGLIVFTGSFASLHLDAGWEMSGSFLREFKSSVFRVVIRLLLKNVKKHNNT